MTLFQSNVSGRYKLCGKFTKIYAFPSFTLKIYLQFFKLISEQSYEYFCLHHIMLDGNTIKSIKYPF